MMADDRKSKQKHKLQISIYEIFILKILYYLFYVFTNDVENYVRYRPEIYISNQQK